MKHTIGLYLIPKNEEWEKQEIKILWNNIRGSVGMERLQRYKNKLCQLYSEGVYDHLKALDLIFYAVDGQRRLMAEVIRPNIYIAWQLTRYIVRDLENKVLQIPKAEIARFWEKEMDQANAVFEKWWELNKKGLTKYAHGGYNVL